MSVHDELEKVMASRRWRDLRPYLLAAPDTDTGKAVRAWYRARRAHWNAEYEWSTWVQDPELDGRGALRALAVGLATPEQAASRLGKLTFGWHVFGADALAVEVALARGREFCRPFLEAACGLRFSRDDEWHMSWLARLGLPLVAAGAADLPQRPEFGRGWARHFASGEAWRQWHEHAQALEQGRPTAPPTRTLADELRASPFVAEGLALALATPDALAAFESFLTPGWELGPAVAQLVSEGVLDRGQVIRWTLEALTRQDTANTQKALAKLLTALDFDSRDAARRMPLIQSLLATTRGSVTAVLLGPAVEAAGDDDVVGIAATIFSRPEKAQRSTLLKALVAKDPPWGPDALVRALSIAVDLPDQATVTRAAKALAALGVQAAPVPQPPLAGLWADPPAVGEAAPAQEVEPTEAAMTAALSRMVVSMDASDGAMFWDAAVRWAKADLGGARGWAKAVEDRLGELPRPYGFYALRDDHRATVDAHRELCRAVEKHHDGFRRSETWAVSSRTTTQVVHDVFFSETRLRLGEIPYLVSTPTRSNGSLDLTTLAERLRGYGATCRVGPLDLFVALTRLEPTDPASVGALDGISVALWSPEREGGRGLFRRQSAVDAVSVVRQWVGRGGLPDLRVGHEGAGIVVAPPELPVPRDVFGGLPPSLETGHVDGVHQEYPDYSLGVETDAGMLPVWVDLLAARLQRSFDQKSRFPPRMLRTMAAAPRPGAAVTHVVAATLSHADEDWRLLAVDAALTMMGRGLWSADDYTTCCLHLLADGELRLARLAHSWEQLVLAGALKSLWPSALAVVERACALERKPAGLAELLGMLRQYVASVPDVVLPASVVSLAGSRGSSKAKGEAAALLEAAS